MRVDPVVGVHVVEVKGVTLGQVEAIEPGGLVHKPWGSGRGPLPTQGQRVLKKTEGQSRAMRNVAFLD